MGEILGIGLSHFSFKSPDETMSMRVKRLYESGTSDPLISNVENWPEEMQAEWGEDEGLSFAREHRAGFVEGCRRLRREIDEFAPDAVVIFGDDQYENFHEDLLPPFAIYIQDRFEMQPFHSGERGPNVFGIDPETVVEVPGNRAFAHELTVGLIEKGFDIPYAYGPLHLEKRMSHAFEHTILHLDWDQRGFPYKIVPFHMNSYGSRILIRYQGAKEEGAYIPGPSPARCFALGEAVAEIARASSDKVVLVASSSWSHATLTKKHHFLYPDVEADKARFDELVTGKYTDWGRLSRDELNDAGQYEFFNWIPLAGAMTHLHAGPPAYAHFLQSYLMNSDKPFVSFGVH